jgi:hypothetical protein
MARDLIYFLMVMYILAIIKTESSKDLGSISGQKVQFMMGILKMGLSMVEVNGESKRMTSIVTDMKENIF